MTSATEPNLKLLTPTPLDAKPTPPVIYWSRAGALVLAFIVYVLATWISGPHFHSVDPGPDPLPALQATFIYWVQIVTLMLGVVAMWLVVIRPWIREKQLTTTGMLYICWLTLFFQDPMMNYTSAHVLYNSYMFNMGTWTLGSTPGWTSPNGSNLPEPLLLIVVGYTIIGYCLCFPVLALLNKIKEKRPAISKPMLATIGVLILILLDTVFESLLLRTGVYAYPGGIRELTLFAGETYQFPLTEGIFYGGFTIGATMILLLYRDDKGQTFVDRGLDTLKISRFQKQWVKFLALFGYVHISMFLVFTVPMQWFATHSDPYPEGYPSYMINDMCVYGVNRDQCPGPGVMMPRPENNPL
ncbi:spirocyclase AveC family protein [Pseudomaricurvus alkylphenolicus]|uniref:spirocyclase AveC family protein n=1 Tax=Pseudomaricurvus alkylphenolicus TaxID=1306991 RepID=UPI0014222E71|nr:spirocyclase AveC family protein [Pseudomaricurvus alkylphenolicus]NIB38824.1 spirocyclase AveC family protein [Pseudomaricurvus alkylphenolicus]